MQIKVDSVQWFSFRKQCLRIYWLYHVNTTSGFRSAHLAKIIPRYFTMSFLYYTHPFTERNIPPLSCLQLTHLQLELKLTPQAVAKPITLAFSYNPFTIKSTRLMFNSPCANNLKFRYMSNLTLLKFSNKAISIISLERLSKFCCRHHGLASKFNVGFK